VESYFDAKIIAERLLNSALSVKMRSENRNTAGPIEIRFSRSDIKSDSTTQLMVETLEQGLSTFRTRPVQVETMAREFFEDSSSFAAERLRVTLDDGEELNVFFKDLNPHNQLEAARLIRNTQLEGGLRELQMYQQVLTMDDFETPHLYASRWEPEQAIHWLFLEYVGRSLKKATDPDLWREAARWAARFHAKSARWYGRWTGFLPRYDQAHYEDCGKRISEKLPHTDPEDRPVIQKALEHFSVSIDRLLDLPQSVVHGQYYGHNLVIRKAPPDCQVTAIDWESAAIGPSFFDIACLSAGKWALEQKQQMRRAYFDEYRLVSQTELTWNDFMEALFDLNIYQSLLWLGWWPDRNFSRHFGRWIRELERLMSERSYEIALQKGVF
jgi:aminoglycoside/choline kinase family phosphotransferase